MFSTPTSRLISRENTDSIMRKPHGSSARKAFQDRSVNSKLNQPSKNTPLDKHKIKLFCDLKAPETAPVGPSSNEVPVWMMETSTMPTDDYYLHSHIKTSKADTNNMIFGKMLTPPPSPIQDCHLDFEILQLPSPTSLKFKFSEEVDIPASVWEDGDYDLPWERPQINFDY